MRAWQVKEWCEPDEIQFVELPKPKADPGWCLIRIKAVSVNYFDILSIQGKYQFKPPLPFTPGNEVAGIVEEAAEGSRFKAGDRVMAMPLVGAYAEYAVAPDLTIFKMPDAMSFEHGAAFQIVYQTSYFGLVHRAGIREGDTVLISAAAGGVGLAAVQIAKALGARVIAAVGSPDKFQICREHGADLVVSYQTDRWVQDVRNFTGGTGVNIIYDAVGGDFLDHSLKIIAWEGRVVIVGFASGRIPQIPANRILLKNIAIVGLHWGDYRRHDMDLVDRTQETLYDLYSKGRIRPVIYKSFPLAQAREALADMGNRKTYGKIILVP